MSNLPICVIEIRYDADGNGHYVASIFNKQSGQRKELYDDVDRDKVRKEAEAYADLLGLSVVE